MANTQAETTQRTIRNLQDNYDSKRAEKNTLLASVERLQETEWKLKNELSELRSLKISLSSAKEKLGNSRFRGTRRNSFDQKLEQVYRSIESDQGHYEQQEELVTEKIRELESRISVLEINMRHINNNISVLSQRL